MREYIEVVAVVEGKTEQIFIESILSPYLSRKHIFMKAMQLRKPGQKGGDVRFARVLKDLGLLLKQRSDTYVTTMVDYYGVKEWPAIDQVPDNATPSQIAGILNHAAKQEMIKYFQKNRPDYRFIPYMAIHELEALLFSDPAALSSALRISETTVQDVLSAYGEPEAINTHPSAAPSKQLDQWSHLGKFPKTTLGIAIAKRIGIPRIREKCPVFNAWIATFERIVEGAV